MKMLREIPRVQLAVSSDLISRQEAIDAIHEDADWLAAQGSDWQVERMERDKSILMSLPSAEKAQLSGEDATFDYISRQDAVKTMYDACEDIDHESLHIDVIVDALENLPSAETEIIRCKNCKHRDSNDCPMHYEEWIEIDEGDGYFDTDTIIHDWTTDEGFCHCAELRGKEE